MLMKPPSSASPLSWSCIVARRAPMFVVYSPGLFRLYHSDLFNLFPASSLYYSDVHCVESQTRIPRLVFVGYLARCHSMADACLDGAGRRLCGGALEAHGRHIRASAIAADGLARRQAFRRVAGACSRSLLQTLLRAPQCSAACCRHQRRPSQAVTGGKWRR